MVITEFGKVNTMDLIEFGSLTLTVFSQIYSIFVWNLVRSKQ